MAKILVLLCHPVLEKSRINSALVSQIRSLDNVRIHDLYEAYPDFMIDVHYEQQLLLEHDIIVWHHPIYWYSSPPLLKQWIDLVLEHGWAYGSKGKALAGKYVLSAITAGGGKDAYTRQGLNKYTLREYLIPFQQTAKLCRMEYLPPFVVQGTHRLEEKDARAYGRLYRDVLESLSTGIDHHPGIFEADYLIDYFNNRQ